MEQRWITHNNNYVQVIFMYFSLLFFPLLFFAPVAKSAVSMNVHNLSCQHAKCQPKSHHKPGSPGSNLMTWCDYSPWPKVARRVCGFCGLWFSLVVVMVSSWPKVARIVCGFSGLWFSFVVVFLLPPIVHVTNHKTWWSCTEEGMGAEEKRKKTKIIPGTQPKARAGWPKRLRLVQATPWADFAVLDIHI